jgi:hypothetical protein
MRSSRVFCSPAQQRPYELATHPRRWLQRRQPRWQQWSLARVGNGVRRSAVGVAASRVAFLPRLRQFSCYVPQALPRPLLDDDRFFWVLLCVSHLVGAA